MVLASALNLKKVKIDLVYDVSSAFSYIALVTLLRYQEPWNLDINLKPASQGAILKAAGTPNRVVVPVKGAYFERDVVRLAERWGLDIRTPPDRPSSATTEHIFRFLFALKEIESPDVLLQCTLLFFEEIFSIHTSVSSSSFFHCIIKEHPASRGRGLLSEVQFKKILAHSASPELLERTQKDVTELVAKHHAFGCPWIVAFKVPIDDRPLSVKEKREHPLEHSEWQEFFGVDRMDALGYYLGPEYEWKGPFPDGRERFRPRATGLPGLPVDVEPFNIRNRL